MHLSPSCNLLIAKVSSAIGLIWILSGCTDRPESLACATADQITCEDAGSSPTFQQVFEQVFRPSCGRAGFSCHGADGAQGGLRFDELNQAWSSMQKRQAIRLDDVACSPLIKRLVSNEPMLRMPPADALSMQNRCLIVRWIEAGATRE